MITRLLLPLFCFCSGPFVLSRADVFTLPDITREANGPSVDEHFDFVPNDGWNGNPPDIIRKEESLYLKFTVRWAPAAKIGKFRVGFNVFDNGAGQRLAAQYEGGGFVFWTNNLKDDPDGAGPATAEPTPDRVDTRETTAVTFVLKIDQMKAVSQVPPRPDCWYGDIGRQDDACAFLYINPNLAEPEAGQSTKWATWRSGNYESQGVMFRTDTADVDLHFSDIAIYTGDDTPFGNGPARPPGANLQLSPAPAMSSDYAAWSKALYPGLGPPEADDDSDGFSNGFEHLFGLNPKDKASSNPYAGAFDTRNQTFRYSRRSGKLTGMNFRIEYSTNGQDWREDKAARQEITPATKDLETVVVRVSPALLNEPELFVRVTAEPGSKP